MTIRQGPPDEEAVFDVCVIGSGPAGLATALSCGRQGLSVIILEGGAEISNKVSKWSVQIIDKAVHAPIDITTRECFGGTSTVWGGTCVPFDPIDFNDRHWVPGSGWPVKYDDLCKWTNDAADFLDCGTIFEDVSKPSSLGSINTASLGRLTRRAAMNDVYREEIALSKNIILCLGSPVRELICSENGHYIKYVEVVSVDKPKKVKSSKFVIAGGGLRTTHLLQSFARKWPLHFAGGRAPLGRYYMGHVTGEIANIVFADPVRAIDYLYTKDDDSRWHQRRIKTSVAQQEANELLATAFMLRAPSPADHRHCDGSLSLLALAGSFPIVAQELNSERLNGAVVDLQQTNKWAHLRNIAASPLQTFQSLYEMLKCRRVENLPVMVPNRSGRYALRYHAEQLPNRNSQVYLDPADQSGLVIDFQYDSRDFSSIIRSHQILDEYLRSSGVGYLEYNNELNCRQEAIKIQATDGYHQIGTTRMSLDPTEGVVNGDCRVHGLDNLFVASASTFPTSSSANPTLTIVALALRLANHLVKT